MQRLKIAALVALIALLISGLFAFNPNETEQDLLSPEYLIQEIPIEQYNGDISALPEGAYLKTKVLLDARSGAKKKQVFVVLP